MFVVGVEFDDNLSEKLSYSELQPVWRDACTSRTSRTISLGLNKTSQSSVTNGATNILWLYGSLPWQPSAPWLPWAVHQSISKDLRPLGTAAEKRRLDTFSCQTSQPQTCTEPRRFRRPAPLPLVLVPLASTFSISRSSLGCG